MPLLFGLVTVVPGGELSGLVTVIPGGELSGLVTVTPADGLEGIISIVEPPVVIVTTAVYPLSLLALSTLRALSIDELLTMPVHPLAV